MATYPSLANRLPDPDYKIGYWGAGPAASGDPGPGFASVKLTSDQKILVSRTNSQRVLAKAPASNKVLTIEEFPLFAAKDRAATP